MRGLGEWNRHGVHGLHTGPQRSSPPVRRSAKGLMRSPYVHERSECVARGPKAVSRASARETCEGSVGADAAATHIDRLDACSRPGQYTIKWISVHAIVYRQRTQAREVFRGGQQQCRIPVGYV
jgi:hypothetical protein